jgi:hypothetical protein
LKKLCNSMEERERERERERKTRVIESLTFGVESNHDGDDDGFCFRAARAIYVTKRVFFLKIF